MNILIVSEYIAPVQAVASIRWTKISKYLKRTHSDVSITVLTNQLQQNGENAQKNDLLLEKDMTVFDEYWTVPRSWALILYERVKRRQLPATRELQTQIQSMKQGGLGLRIKKELLLLVRDIKDVICYHQAMHFLKKKSESFDVIVSTYGPAWPHLVAEQLKKKQIHAFWLADFRDPYAKDTDPPCAWRRHDRFTKKHCSKANAITFVSDGFRLNKPVGVPFQMVTNGFDPAEARPPFPPDRFRIVFTGALYGESSGIGIVCGAVKDLMAEGALKDGIVVYAGADDSQARTQAARYDAQDCLRTVGLLPRIQALELQQKAAILLQLDWSNAARHCEWSGKMYEYMMARKPILFVMTGSEPNSYPSRYMEKLGGFCYEQCRHESAYPQMKRFIMNKYLEWKETGNVTIKVDEPYIQQFSYEQIAERVWKRRFSDHDEAEFTEEDQ